MEASHTPGPLVVVPSPAGYEVYSATTLVAEFPINNDLSALKETKANADLFAAAPDLLEALEACLGPLGEMGYSTAANAWAAREIRKQASAAIARAKGESR